VGVYGTAGQNAAPLQLRVQGSVKNDAARRRRYWSKAQTNIADEPLCSREGIAMKFLPSFWKRRTERDTPHSEASIPGIWTEAHGDKTFLKVDLDIVGREAAPSIEREIIDKSGFPLFEGTIEHGYAKRSIGSTRQCPRCGAVTRQCNAHFIYATNIAPRVILVPAGYFCTACPTVIIDEEIIAMGAKEGCRFRAVVGIDHGGNTQPDLFRTWNGEEPVLVLDENQQIMDLVTKAQLHSHEPGIRPRDRNKEKRRRKMERQARKRNRNRP
jgi:hypothetical protein